MRRGTSKAAIRWQAENGSNIEFLEALAEETGVIPETLKTRPRLSEIEAEAVEAFWFLSPARQVGFGGISGLLVQEIEAYARVFCVARPELFARLVRSADLEFLRIFAERDKGKP